MTDALTPFNLVVKFEFEDGTEIAVGLNEVARGVRHRNHRPINARILYDHLNLMTSKDEQTLRRKLIEEVLPAMAGGYRYHYSDKARNTPLEIAKMCK